MKNQRGLLIEIMICVLFFALCATVLLETFVASREYSDRSGVSAGALVEMQNLAERLYMQDDPEQLLAEAGYIMEDNAYVRDFDGYRIAAEISVEAMDAGAIREIDLRAYDGDRLIVHLPCAGYFPGEVAA